MRPRTLNAELIRTRRLELKLSQRNVADLIGANTAMVSRLELGEELRDFTLHQLLTLAQALQLAPGDMFSPDATAPAPTRAASSDDVKVEALLGESTRRASASELATALEWDLKRVRAALHAVQDRLRGTGQELSDSGTGRWSLRPRKDVISSAERQRLAGAQSSDRGMTISEARVLQDVMNDKGDHVWERTLSNPQRAALSGLIKLGLVTKGDHGVALTDDAQFSLDGHQGEG